MVLSRRFFATRGVLLVMKTLEDERYVVIKAYKCTISEIWRDSFVLAYIACTSYPYIQSLPSLVPCPTPSFPSLLSTVKRGGPGTFPHVSDVKGRKG